MICRPLKTKSRIKTSPFTPYKVEYLYINTAFVVYFGVMYFLHNQFCQNRCRLFTQHTGPLGDALGTLSAFHCFTHW